MTNAKAVFRAIIDQTNISKGLYNYIGEQKVPIDASDLLRWQWVIAVSALDKYIHDIVRIGMIQEFKGLRPKTDKYNSFRIDLMNYSSISSSPTPELEFERAVIQFSCYIDFQ